MRKGHHWVVCFVNVVALTVISVEADSHKVNGQVERVSNWIVGSRNDGDLICSSGTTNSGLTFRWLTKAVDNAIWSNCDKGHQYKNAPDCGHLKERTGSSTLELEDWKKGASGDYLCQITDKTNGTVQEMMFRVGSASTLTRYECWDDEGKDDCENKKKTQSSVTIIEGDILRIYCNASGLTFEEVTWWKDDIDITGNLTAMSGNFTNFTKASKTDDLGYLGISNPGHRGIYVCQVNLITTLDGVRHVYPVKYKFSVRVQDAGRWQLPLYIILAQVVFIALFTAVIARREKNSGQADGVYDDSDDEDEEEVPKSKNGSVATSS